jgi:chromosome segregation ATPase
MVWSMDTQLKTVTSGLERMTTAEQAIERTEKMAAEAASRLTAMAAARQEAERDLTAFKGDVKQLMDALAARTASLDDRKAEFENFEARARGLQESLTRAETRMSALAALDKQMNAVTRQTESMVRRFETLSSQAEALGRKQDVFEGLRRSSLTRATSPSRPAGRWRRCSRTSGRSTSCAAISRS